MARATWLLGATSILGLATSVYLWLDNRALRDDLATHDKPAVAQTDRPVTSARPADPWLDRPTTRSAAIPQRAGEQPALPEEKKDTRLERRQRRTEEFAAMFGRGADESPEDYKARVMPLIKAGLAMPRARADEMRKEAEAKAHVSPEQSKQLDAAFDKVYDNVLDYTNKAIADGTLSPYERNVAGWLGFAGGLGGMLDDANGSIGKILDPSQLRAMSDSGFEWGEYLGLNAPWENLNAPPPQKPK